MTGASEPSSRSGWDGRRFSGDGGAVLVEAAFAMPFLLLVVLGMFDFGILEFQRSQATSAARDGARTGVVLPLDSANASATTAAIASAVRGRLARQTDYSGLTIQSYCDGGGGTTIATSCGSAQPGVTRLVVKVSWDYQSSSFLGPIVPKTVTATSSMLYEGARSGTGGSSSACLVSAVQARTPIPTLNAGSLSTDLLVDFTTNGSAACTGFTTTLVPVGLTTPNWTGTVTTAGTAGVAKYVAGTSTFTDGDYELRITVGGLTSYVTVPLKTPPTCSVSSIASVQVDPFPQQGNQTALKEQGNSGTLQTTSAKVTFSAADVCSGVAATWTIKRSDNSGNAITGSIPDLATGTFTAPGSPGVSGFAWKKNQTYTITITWGANTFVAQPPFPVT